MGSFAIQITTIIISVFALLIGTANFVFFRITSNREHDRKKREDRLRVDQHLASVGWVERTLHPPFK
jgi:high-affinity nickel permease